jgi:hypothetical protein
LSVTFYRQRPLKEHNQKNSMKLILLPCLLCLFLFAAPACKKDKQVPSVTGTWELRKTFSGWGPTVEYAPGNGSLIVFDKGRYKRYRDGRQETEGTYHVEIQGKENRIIFDREQPSELKHAYTFIGENQLDIHAGPEIADGDGSLYERIR